MNSTSGKHTDHLQNFKLGFSNGPDKSNSVRGQKVVCVLYFFYIKSKSGHAGWARHNFIFVSNCLVLLNYGWNIRTIFSMRSKTASCVNFEDIITTKSWSNFKSNFPNKSLSSIDKGCFLFPENV